MLTTGNAISNLSIKPTINYQSVSGFSNQVKTYIPGSVEKFTASSESLDRQSGSADVKRYGQELAYSKQRPGSFFSKCKITNDGSKLCELQKGDKACKVIKETVCNKLSPPMVKSINNIEEQCDNVRAICGD